MNKRVVFTVRLIAVAIAVFVFVNITVADVAEHRTDKERIDSLEAKLPYLEKKFLSTLFNPASLPISFSGDGRLKFQFHNANIYPAFMDSYPLNEGEKPYVSGDKHYLQSGWDEAALKLGMVVHPGRNTVLFTKLGFSQTFAGHRVDSANAWEDSTFKQTEFLHNSANLGVNIFEDMSAGIAVRSVPASFWFRMGNISWMEASPLSLWRAQPKLFAWDYLPYEVEEPIVSYYQNKMVFGESVGRSAWHKKPFHGIDFESLNLPADLYLNLFYGKFGAYDVFEREYFDFATELGYAAEGSVLNIIETGIDDSYRHLLHARLAKLIKKVTLGLNFNKIFVSDDIIFAENPGGRFFNNMFNIKKTGFGPDWFSEFVLDTAGDTIPLDIGKGYYKKPMGLSFDVKGSPTDKIEFHADLGLSMIDTEWVWADTERTLYDSPVKVKKRESVWSDPLPAFYGKFLLKSKVKLQADLIYASKGYYAPFSFVNPMDAFAVFNSNLFGPGMFAGHSDASPYFQNTAGMLLSVSPKLKGYGHLKFKYGQHFQIKKARDLIFLPFRLNGMDMNSFMISSYSRWGTGTYDFPVEGKKYHRMLADESYDPSKKLDGTSNGDNTHLDQSPEAGGIRADELSVFMGFVPYEDSIRAALNYMSSNGKISRDRTVALSRNVMFMTTKDAGDSNIVYKGDTVGVRFATDTTVKTDANAFIPMHKKYTYNLDLDFAYDIGGLFNFKRDFILGGYASVSGISTSFKALEFNEKSSDNLLWSLYLRFEPAIAITEKFYLIGLVAYENWRGGKAWANVNYEENGNENTDNPIFKRVPIDFRDAAYGLGFDWDMLDRVTLHSRVKYFTHKEMSFTENSLSNILASLEIKTYF